MPSRSLPAWRVAAAVALFGAAVGGAVGWARAVLPRGEALAAGLRVGGVEVGPGEDARAVAEARARALLDRRVRLRHGGGIVAEASLLELGATVDVDRIAGEAHAVGREGDFVARLDAALEARRGHLDVPVRVSLPAEPLAERLARHKEETDTPPKAARLDLARRTATPHRAGRYLDVYAAAGALDGLGASADADVEVPDFEIAPLASSEAVVGIDTSRVLSTFTTRYGYLGGQAGRAQNVARAASQMDGVVLMPGEVVSFNDNVGPRSLDNGFAPAPEIYKGEMREGIGGGTCQVAGTLHAAAFFGGIDVVERSNHSRPSGYIHLGLDATVVYPVVDLKLRNPFEFPIVVHATTQKGTLVFELLGREKPATVDFSTDTVGVAAYKRKIEEAPWLEAGKVKLKQKGIRGLSIRKTRVIHLAGGPDKVEVTTDTYPPTFEIYLVPPGTDVATALPPLPGDDAPPARGDG